jgi:putative ABC transport system substrate-binding protein
VKLVVRNGTRATKPLVWLTTALCLTYCFSTEAQQPSKIYRIGRLGGSFSSATFSIDGLRRELRELGYIEGKNVVFEFRHAEEKPERLPFLAEELARLNVDVIVAGGPNDTLAAMKATRKIPIVFTDTPYDPVARGLVTSIPRPGGNVTGFYSMADVLAGKRLEVLKESLPELTRVAVLLFSRETSEPQWAQSERTAGQRGVQIYSIQFGGLESYEIALREAIKTRVGALSVTRHRLSQTYQKKILEHTAKHRLPAIYWREDFVSEGGLMSYGADEVESFKRLATLIHKVLKGSKPAELPVEQPTKFELVINLKTAKQIGLTIPPHVLARADRVIK